VENSGRSAAIFNGSERSLCGYIANCCITLPCANYGNAKILPLPAHHEFYQQQSLRHVINDTRVRTLVLLIFWANVNCVLSGTPESEPHKTTAQHYVCHFTDHAPTIDGGLDKPAWNAAPWSSDFQDIEGDSKPKPRFRTRIKMLWDENYFYIAAELEEPHVWATLTQHDAVIFQDNDFEVFIDPDGDTLNYYEFEINALNTGWDLLLDKPYKAGGKPSNAWEIPGLKTAVHINGTINNPADKDVGWTVEIAFPWKVLAQYSRQKAPPAEGDDWRVNFSRVEWLTEIIDGKYRKLPGKKEDNWVWSPQGLVDMHVPEKWGFVQFTRKTNQ
jgi:hypothetical protein